MHSSVLCLQGRDVPVQFHSQVAPEQAGYIAKLDYDFIKYQVHQAVIPKILEELIIKYWNILMCESSRIKNIRCSIQHRWVSHRNKYCITLKCWTPWPQTCHRKGFKKEAAIIAGSCNSPVLNSLQRQKKSSFNAYFSKSWKAQKTKPTLMEKKKKKPTHKNLHYKLEL